MSKLNMSTVEKEMPEHLFKIIQEWHLLNAKKQTSHLFWKMANKMSDIGIFNKETYIEFMQLVEISKTNTELELAFDDTTTQYFELTQEFQRMMSRVAEYLILHREEWRVK